ncbi:ATP-binding protein [candidate division KSB1 bacterium]|nr:ATP-binding protein [candidate division KSB1 bacterium]
MQDKQIPRWIAELINQYYVNHYHQFLLDGNIYDSFIWPFPNAGQKNETATAEAESGDTTGTEKGNKLETSFLYQGPSVLPMREFLFNFLFYRKFDPIVYYSASSGFHIFEKHNPVVLPGRGGENTANPKELKNCLIKQLGAGGKTTPAADVMNIDSKVIKELSQLENILSTSFISTDGDEYSIAIIIDYVDKLLQERPPMTERYITEMLQRWTGIIYERNLSILIADNREFLPVELYNESYGTLPIRIMLPDAEYRRDFFQVIRQLELSESVLHANLKNNAQLNFFVQMTKGFGICDLQYIEKVCNQAHDSPELKKHFFSKKDVSFDDVVEFIKQFKKEVIQNSSRGMLIPMESSLSFDCIGGLDQVRDYFQKVSQALENITVHPENINYVPKGILLTGPPGTGKSLLAKALAHETGVSLVKMGDIRSMWVGESERNLSFTLNFLKNMAPVIVFIDEIDQAVGSRHQGRGDSGVSGRIFGKILEFMGDNDNRGKVVWIAATNRADLLDDAMIRRFDRVIPVLLPGSTAHWVSVLQGISNQLSGLNELLTENAIKEFVKEKISKLRQFHSGSSMEMVLRRTFEQAVQNKKATVGKDDIETVFGTFKTNFNTRIYELQTLVSLAACNELAFIPKPETDGYSYGFDGMDDAVSEALESKTNAPLFEKIQLIQ